MLVIFMSIKRFSGEIAAANPESLYRARKELMPEQMAVRAFEQASDANRIRKSDFFLL